MPPEFTAEQARRLRWRHQLLAGSELAPVDVVRHGAAWQGQNLPAALRAIAIRSAAGTTLADVRRAVDEGHVVRSWPMRGTLFLTTREVLATLLYFTAERIHKAAARRRAELGLDDATVARAREELVAAMSERTLTRAGALEMWEAAGISIEGGRGYHLLAHLALDGEFVWGPFAPGGKDQVLAPAELAAPSNPEAGLAQVMRSYVAARAPVTMADVAWWTGLPLGLMRRVAADLEDLVEVEVAGERGWMLAEQLDADVPDAVGAALVPAFDEWILGYKDRSLIADPDSMEAVLPGRNGVFRPAVLVDGVVVGTWTKATSRKGAHAVQLVANLPARARKAIDAAVAAWPHD